MISRIEPKIDGGTFYLEAVVLPEEHTLHADSSTILVRVIEMFMRTFNSEPSTDRLAILSSKILAIGFLSIQFACEEPMEVQVDIDENLTTVITGPQQALDAAFQKIPMSDELRNNVTAFVSADVKITKG